MKGCLWHGMVVTCLQIYAYELHAWIVCFSCSVQHGCAGIKCHPMGTPRIPAENGALMMSISVQHVKTTAMVRASVSTRDVSATKVSEGITVFQ